MKGINRFKHYRLLQIVGDMQQRMQHEVDPDLLNALQEESDNLHKLFQEYTALLQQLEESIKDYELKERFIRLSLLSKPLRELAKKNDSAPVRQLIVSLNSCSGGT